MAWQALAAAGAQVAGSLLGSSMGGMYDRKMQKRQFKHEKKFARNRIQWAAEDARAAGLSPLVAAGGSASPSGVSGGGSRFPNLGSPFADAIRQNRAEKLRTAEIAQNHALETRRLDIMEKEVDARLQTSLNAQKHRLPAGANPGISSMRLPVRKPNRLVLPDGRHSVKGPFGRFKMPDILPAGDVTEHLGEMAEWIYSPMIGARMLYDWISDVGRKIAPGGRRKGIRRKRKGE